MPFLKFIVHTVGSCELSHFPVNTYTAIYTAFLSVSQINLRPSFSVSMWNPGSRLQVGVGKSRIQMLLLRVTGIQEVTAGIVLDQS